MIRTALLAALLLAGGESKVRIALEEHPADQDGKLAGLVKAAGLEPVEFECGSRCHGKSKGVWRYDACADCGGKPVDASKIVKGNCSAITGVAVKDGALEIGAGNCAPTLTLLLLSAVEKCAAGAGIKIRRAGSLLGAFALHAGKDDAERLAAAIRGVEGVKSAVAAGGVVYVNQGHHVAVAYAAVDKASRDAGAPIADISWAVNRNVDTSEKCSIGFR